MGDFMNFCVKKEPFCTLKNPPKFRENQKSLGNYWEPPIFSVNLPPKFQHFQAYFLAFSLGTAGNFRFFEQRVIFPIFHKNCKRYRVLSLEVKKTPHFLPKITLFFENFSKIFRYFIGFYAKRHNFSRAKNVPLRKNHTRVAKVRRKMPQKGG